MLGQQVGFEGQTVYVGVCIYIDSNGQPITSHRGRVYSLEDLLRIRTVWRNQVRRGHIVQPEVLFPRALALSFGGLNTDNHFTMDYEFWGKLLLAGSRFQYTDIPFGMFRKHANQKTHDMLRQTHSLIETAAKLVQQEGVFCKETTKEILEDLRVYIKKYEVDYWKGSGRLAKLGLPRTLVLSLRHLRVLVQIIIG